MKNRPLRLPLLIALLARPAWAGMNALPGAPATGAGAVPAVPPLTAGAQTPELTTTLASSELPANPAAIAAPALPGAEPAQTAFAAQPNPLALPAVLTVAGPGAVVSLDIPAEVGERAATARPAAPLAQAPAQSDEPAVSLEALDESLHPLRQHPNQLGAHFLRLRAAFHLMDEAGEVPASPGAHWAGGVLASIKHELVRMTDLAANHDAEVYERILAQSGLSLAQIARHINAGRMDPSRTLRLSESDEPAPAYDRPLRVGVYPVAADPFQWGHLLVALKAAARYQLDKVVFVLAGDDARKPEMTPVAQRHPMGKAVLDLFGGLFAYSPIAVGTDFDGETNIFRLLGLNFDRAIHAIYLVGDDHYALIDRRGNPDTLPKLERNLANLALGHNPAHHEVRVAFIEREGRKDPVPTTLQVDFLPGVGFEVASSMIRKQGMYFLMPATAFEIARSLALYGLTPQ